MTILKATGERKLFGLQSPHSSIYSEFGFIYTGTRRSNIGCDMWYDYSTVHGKEQPDLECMRKRFVEAGWEVHKDDSTGWQAWNKSRENRTISFCMVTDKGTHYIDVIWARYASPKSGAKNYTIIQDMFYTK